MFIVQLLLIVTILGAITSLVSLIIKYMDDNSIKTCNNIAIVLSG